MASYPAIVLSAQSADRNYPGMAFTFPRIPELWAKPKRRGQNSRQVLLAYCTIGHFYLTDRAAAPQTGDRSLNRRRECK
jgi:hypothetical protein